jgi:transposase-like protein
MAERGLLMAHTTIMRWVQRYEPEIEKRWRRFARAVGQSWRVDETGFVTLTGLPALGWHRSKRGDDQLPRLPLPSEITQHSVWLYLRFTLSFRDVEDLLAERGIIVSYETIRRRGRGAVAARVKNPSELTKA